MSAREETSHFDDRRRVYFLRTSLSLLLFYFAIASYGQRKLPIADTVGINLSSAKSQVSLSAKDLHKMDSATNRITFKIDSLQGKGLPTAHYQKKLDSINLLLQNQLSMKRVSGKINGEMFSVKSKLNAPRDSIQKEVNKKALALKKKIRKKTSSLDSITAKANDTTGKIKLPASSVINPNLPNQNLPNVNLPNSSVNAPGLNLPNETNELNKLNKNLALPQSQEVKKIENELKQVEAVPKKELNSMAVAKDINEVKKDAKGINSIEKKADDYNKDIRDIKQGDKKKVEGLEKDTEKQVEKSATNLSEVKELKKEEKAIQLQKNAFQQYEDMLKDLKKGGVPEVKNISTKSLPNPFIGQEAKLQAGIAQLDKLKKKYGNIPDSRYLPKHVPNEMKGKPFLERLVPGISYQVYTKNKTGIDFSLYLMYRMTGRVRLGTGGGERFIVDGKQPYVSDGRVQFFRVMADFRGLGSFYFHAEEEWMHYGSGAQSILHMPSDPPAKEWNTKLNIGVIKTYKISRRLNGQTQVLYNSLDLSNFPQNKNTSIRFGIEYKFGIHRHSEAKSAK